MPPTENEFQFPPAIRKALFYQLLGEANCCREYSACGGLVKVGSDINVRDSLWIA